MLANGQPVADDFNAARNLEYAEVEEPGLIGTISGRPPGPLLGPLSMRRPRTSSQ